jgi:hypothetical protein
MPQNAIIRADGTGDYTTIIDWIAAEGSSNYGAVTVGRVDGFFDQGSSALFLSGTAPHGLKLEAFSTSIAFDGTQRNLCGLKSTANNRGVDFLTSSDIEIDGLEIIYDGSSGTHRALEDSGSGTYTLRNCLVLVEAGTRIFINTFSFIDCAIVSKSANSTTSNGATSNFTGCNIFGQNVQDILGNSDVSTNTVVYNTGSGADFGGSGTLSNTASSDNTASTLTNIVIADNFVSTTPIATKDYRILSGSPLDTNGIGSFVQTSSGITVTATLGTITYTSQDTTVAVTGTINTNATLGTISYSSNDAVVGLTGGIDVTATLGTISYSSNNTSIAVTGSVDVVTTLGTISYSSNNTTVSVGGAVSVQSTLGTISYTSNDVSIELAGTVQVPATLGTINFSSNNVDVLLTGLIDVNATLGTISYTSNNTTVFVQDGQSFGVVTASFADNLYKSSFKQNSITVNFKG